MLSTVRRRRKTCTSTLKAVYAGRASYSALTSGETVELKQGERKKAGGLIMTGAGRTAEEGRTEGIVTTEQEPAIVVIGCAPRGRTHKSRRARPIQLESLVCLINLFDDRDVQATARSG